MTGKEARCGGRRGGRGFRKKKLEVGEEAVDICVGVGGGRINSGEENEPGLGRENWRSEEGEVSGWAVEVEVEVRMWDKSPTVGLVPVVHLVPSCC